MSVITVEQFYEQFIKPLPATEQLRLVSLITYQLAVGLPTVEATEVTELPELDTKIWSDTEAYDDIQELSGKQKGSPTAILQLAGTLSLEEADAILQAAQTCRKIDWEMWERVE